MLVNTKEITYKYTVMMNLRVNWHSHRVLRNRESSSHSHMQRLLKSSGDSTTTTWLLVNCYLRRLVFVKVMIQKARKWDDSLSSSTQKCGSQPIVNDYLSISLCHKIKFSEATDFQSDHGQNNIRKSKEERITKWKKIILNIMLRRHNICGERRWSRKTT